jgi:predicted PurR-regulated permease PerM
MVQPNQRHAGGLKTGIHRSSLQRNRRGHTKFSPCTCRTSSAGSSRPDDSCPRRSHGIKRPRSTPLAHPSQVADFPEARAQGFAWSLPPPADAPDGVLADVSLRTIALGTLVCVGAGLLFAFIVRFHRILFLFLVALILATITRPAVDWLRRRGMRPQFGIIGMYVALLLIIILVVALVAPLVVSQIDAMTARLPTLYADLRQALVSWDNRLVQRLALGLPEQFAMLGADPAPEPAAIEDGPPSLGAALTMVNSVAQDGFVVIAILVLALYWVLEGELITRRALFFVQADRREQVRTVWGEMEGKIGGFFRGQLILMGIVAVLSAIGYLIVGIPYALGLALIAGVCEAIPMFGPTIGMIPAVLVAISLAPDKLLFVVLVGVAVQLLENNLFVPRIMDHSVGINPIVTILAIAAFGALFGFAGALLAIPLAAMLQIIVQRLLALRVAAPEVSRSYISVLRLAARELAADLRKGAGTDGTSHVTRETEAVEDRLEAIAVELDNILVMAETEA